MYNGWEGCLSIPGICAVVPRYKTIHISAYNKEAILHEFSVSDFHARNLQHEIDHLNGLTIFDRIKDNTYISFKSELHNGIQSLSNLNIRSLGNLP